MTEMAMANGLDYITKGGISVTRRRKKIAYEGAIDKHYRPTCGYHHARA